jgi:hypothetical protein
VWVEVIVAWWNDRARIGSEKILTLIEIMIARATRFYFGKRPLITFLTASFQRERFWSTITDQPVILDRASIVLSSQRAVSSNRFLFNTVPVNHPFSPSHSPS